MRKLSKKISMLMVLAMLVSLFSGIVSASAASAWSFYDRTADVVVERNATYVMEKDQYANFDLYKDEAEASTKEYKYTWYSSDEEVVYVDSTNGRLRAQKDAEAGEKAFIYVLIDNKSTEKNENAKRGFYIEIAADEVVEEPTPTEEPVVIEYKLVTKIGDAVLGAETLKAEKDYALTTTVTADGEAVEAVVAYTIDGAAIEKLNVKAGEYTVVVTATIDGEVVTTEEYAIVAEADVPAFVSKKQTTLSAVELTLNSADWAAKANKENIKVAQVIDGVDISELVKSVEVKKDAADVIVVTLYNNLAADKTYKFVYDGFECEASVVGANSDPYSIKVVGGKVAANTLAQAEIKVYNSIGIDVTTDALKYAAEFSADENTYCDVQADGSIYFFEVGKTVVVKAKFDMGWDNEGNEIKDLEAVGEYTSVEPVTYSKPNGYALSDGTKANKDLTYTTGTLKVSLSDVNWKVVAQYEEAPFNADVVKRYIADGSDEHGNNLAYTYKSTNESVLLVDPADGTLLPCKEGYASVYIKKGDTVVGSVSIKVDAARKLNTFTASIADKKLATAMGADSTQIAVTAADQFGVAYGDVTYSIVLDTLQVNGADVVLTDIFDIDNANDLTVVDGKIALTIADTAAAKIADNKIQSIAFTIKATDDNNTNNVKSQRLTVSIKDNAGYTGTVNRKLDLSASKVDTALNKKNLGDYNVTIKLVKTDSDGYDLGLENIALQAAATTAANYSVVITKVGDNNFNVTNETNFFDLAGNVITISPVVNATTKLANGTYKIQLFTENNGKMQPSTPLYLTVEDNTPAVTAVVTKTNIAGGSIADALEFYINGAKVDAGNIVGVTITDDQSISGKQYVRKVDVTLKTKALNGDSALNLEFTKSVDVNQLFTTN